MRRVSYSAVYYDKKHVFATEVTSERYLLCPRRPPRESKDPWSLQLKVEMSVCGSMINAVRHVALHGGRDAGTCQTSRILECKEPARNFHVSC